MAGVGKPHISCIIHCTDRLSLAAIDWRSGAVKVGQVGGFKVSRQDALDLVGQVATQEKEGEGGTPSW